MKIWGIFCLLVSIGAVNAHVVGVSDNGEERSGVGVSHRDDCANESKEGLTSAIEEMEKPEPYVIIETEKLSPVGGGVPSLDPNVVAEIVLPPFTEAELPWWERWWNGVTTWLFGENP